MHARRSMPRPRSALLLLALLGLLVGVAPGVSQAGEAEGTSETFRLKSGKKVRAASVEVLDDRVKATLHVTGGTAVVSYAFARLEPLSLLDLLERHWIEGTSTTADGAAALRISGVARQLGQFDAAVIWLARAAEIDPSLAAKRDAGLDAIRTQRVQVALTDLQDLLKAKRPAALVDAADAALSGELALILTPAEALRLAALRGLAQKMLDRAAGAATPAPDAADGAGNPGQAPVAGLSKSAQQALAKVDAAVLKAAGARDKATDAKIPNRTARRLLETAARALLDARRILRGLAAPLPDAVLARAEAITTTLTTTWLDIADLHRQAHAFDAAARFLRAARLLDPGSTRAREIELQMTATREREAERTRRELDWLYRPSPFHHGFGLHDHGYFGGRSILGRRTVYKGTLGFHRLRHYGFRIGGHGHHHHGSRRVVGRRR